MEPTKMLLLPGEVAPHPNDPVEVRRLMFQTQGLNDNCACKLISVRRSIAKFGEGSDPTAEEYPRPALLVL